MMCVTHCSNKQKLFAHSGEIRKFPRYQIYLAVCWIYSPDLSKNVLFFSAQTLKVVRYLNSLTRYQRPISSVYLTYIHPGRRHNPALLSLLQVKGQPHGNINWQSRVEGTQIALRRDVCYAQKHTAGPYRIYSDYNLTSHHPTVRFDTH